MRNKIKILGIFIIIMFLGIPLISAGFNSNDYTSKWMLCGAFNMTNVQCDIWWGEFADFPTQETNQTIIFPDINMTEIEKKINITLLNELVKFYNKSDIDYKDYSKLNISIDEKYLTAEQYKESIVDLREDLEDKIKDETDGGWLIPTLIILGVINFLGLIFFTIKPKLDKSYDSTPRNDPTARPMIHQMRTRPKYLPTKLKSQEIIKSDLPEEKISWKQHLTNVRKANPNLSPPEVMKKGKESYWKNQP